MTVSAEEKQAVMTLSLEKARKSRNTAAHIRAVEAAVAHFKAWPCITTINIIRLALETAEIDFEIGEAT